jgi:hypothetical protein
LHSAPAVNQPTWSEKKTISREMSENGYKTTHEGQEERVFDLVVAQRTDVI